MTAPTLYNLTIEVPEREESGAVADDLIDRFAGCSPVVATSLHGWVEVVVSVPADDLAHAVAEALGRLDVEPVSVTAMRTAEDDKRVERSGLGLDAATITVAEAAERLGVSEQRVRQRLKDGSLRGEQQGRTWRVLASSVAPKGGKYDPLRDRLLERAGDRQVAMTFDELEQLVGALPPSASEHHGWWGNDRTHVQARAWLDAGFHAYPKQAERRVVFERP